MKTQFALICVTAFSVMTAIAAPMVHVDRFGKSLGGWDGNKQKYADFERSGSKYRTWKPEVTPALNGGVFVSLRIDHLRGILASDDHASLEVTFRADGTVESARSSIALQGRRITSDLITDTGKIGVKAAGLDRAAKVGLDMVTNLSSKVFRENVREPGRVTFPAVLNHNYNLLCMAVGDLHKQQAKSIEGEDQEKATAVKLVIEKPKK